jgi:hypothetical protein
LSLLALLVLALPSCSLFHRGPKSSARLYDGDTSPVIRMNESHPGGPLN